MRFEWAGHVASMLMEALSVFHSSLISLISLRTAEASLRSDDSLGNSAATRVRRFISLLMRSSPCVVRSLRRESAGIRSTVSMALAPSPGLLYPQILALEVPAFEGGRSPPLGKCGSGGQ